MLDLVVPRPRRSRCVAAGSLNTVVTARGTAVNLNTGLPLTDARLWALCLQPGRLGPGTRRLQDYGLRRYPRPVLRWPPRALSRASRGRTRCLAPLLEPERVSWCGDSCAAEQLSSPVTPRGRLEAGGVEKVGAWYL